MSNLEKMMTKLCPEGVNYKPLWEVTYWDKKFNSVDKFKQSKVFKYHYFLANDLKPLIVDDGNVKILTTSPSNLYTSEDLVKGYVSEGEIVSIPWGGNAIVQYYKGKFVTADNRIATSKNKNELNNKFLYYYLKSRETEIGSLYRGSGIKHPDMSKVLDLVIPIPPLPIQEEIVRILDNFTTLEAELEAELDCRKRQYEYYRNKLLTFNKLVGGGTRQISWIKMSEIVEILRGRRLTKRELSDDAPYPVFHGGIEPIGYYTSSNRPANTVMIINVGASAGTVSYSNIDFWSSDGCYCVSQSESLNSKYLYYFLTTKQQYFMSKVRHGGIPTLDAKVIANCLIPVPPIEEQNKIADILDRFETLTNDLQSGLPAEIEARRKQYEYYREKLLTFERKAA